MSKPTRAAAARISAALSLLFLVVYNGCNWLTAQRSDVGTWYYAWERHIPFVPLLIVPYMSIDLFFVGAPFLCGTQSELRTFARRIVWSILIAAGFFILMPLHLAVPRPQPDGWSSRWFQFLYGFDRPFNLFPSLHIALRTILAETYARHTKGVTRVATQVWFSLIGFSTLLTYQHHVVDVLGGFFLGLLCAYFIREETMARPVLVPNWRLFEYYALGAGALAAFAVAGWPWTAVLFWPAIALVLVAAGYAGLGAWIYAKRDGRISWSARVLLAPCLFGQWLSLLYYRRQCPAWDRVTSTVWIGARLSEIEAANLVQAGVTAVLDLTCEFSEAPSALRTRYLNLPVLDLTGMTLDQMVEAAEFIRREAGRGTVYVHCKCGYSRSAMAVGAYLLATGQAESVSGVVTKLRASRPSIVIRPEAIAALEQFVQSHGSTVQRVSGGVALIQSELPEATGRA